MNRKQLSRLGVPPQSLDIAIECVRQAVEQRGDIDLFDVRPKRMIPKVVAAPQVYVADPVYGPLAQSLVDAGSSVPSRASVDYRSWGEGLDAASHEQMSAACRLPVAMAGALMPDAHVGYGLPIGGVLACDNAVIPYGVGVDIACRMKLTITDLPVSLLEANDKESCRNLDQALMRGTRFGTGGSWSKRHDHQVMESDWSISPVTREMQTRAWSQLGTSGSGNHFVEWGLVDVPDKSLGVEPGRYVGLLSHSGSRGAGAQVCNYYSRIAKAQLPASFRDDNQLRHLGWLSMDSHAGQEYFAAMNLMGNYASANHEIIHRQVTSLAGAQSLATVENHHNFAWAEQHFGRTVYVHRKGATPAARGVLGIIPGNMADTAFIVRGKGHPESLNSAAHGAGRCMSRTAALKQFDWQTWRTFLKERGVRLLAGGLDEVPGAYKNIHEVMAAQSDLVEVVGQFQPRIVMMCGDGSRPED